MVDNPPTLVAIDLGAESCRVTLLQWSEGRPRIDLVHRFGNAPVQSGASLHWDLGRILSELENGLVRCGEQTGGPIAAIGVDGWAVDYVRVNETGLPLDMPFCYRDTRTEKTMTELHRRCSTEELFAMSGVQPLRINTQYQLMADTRAGIPAQVPWINLPEYVLARLGGRFVAEYTNATHTGLVDPSSRRWSGRIFELCGLDIEAAPELVSTGADVGRVAGRLRGISAFGNARLLAPACHDTASAVAAVPLAGDDWAYLSSGTWSLLGTLLDGPLTTAAACAAGFTNLGGTGGRICFHKNINGMWLLQQTMAQVCSPPDLCPMEELLAAAARLPVPEVLLNIDDPVLLLPGPMATSINAQRKQHGVAPLEEHSSELPAFASLIFHSLAARYTTVLKDVERLTGKELKRLAVVGGGSRNAFLNRLTADATGLDVHCGVAESSTIGNFAVQLATLEGQPNSQSRITHWAKVLTDRENPGCAARYTRFKD